MAQHMQVLSRKDSKDNIQLIVPGLARGGKQAIVERPMVFITENEVYDDPVWQRR